MTVQTVGDDSLFRVTIDTTVLEDNARRYPRTAYFWLRNFLGASFGQHRQQWLRRKGIKFGRPGAATGGLGGRGGPITVPEVNQGPKGTPPDNFVTYTVEPEQPRFSTDAAARQALDELNGLAQTGSIALQVHEFGMTIRSRGLMALPIRTRPGKPRAWRQRYPNKVLISRVSKTGALVLFERTRKRGGTRTRVRRGAGGKPMKSQPRTKIDVLRPRFLLLRQVRNKPTLEFYSTWDALKGQRGAAFARAATRIAGDIARGVTS